MGRILFLIFLVVPLIEIACFVLIGQAFGLWPTLLGVVLMAFAGALVLRLQGMALLAEIRDTMGRGMLPARALADAMLVAIAGLLLLTPGYFTDLLGLLLLIPPVRQGLYALLRSQMVVVSSVHGAAPRTTGAPLDKGGTIELDEDDWRRR